MAILSLQHYSQSYFNLQFLIANNWMHRSTTQASQKLGINLNKAIDEMQMTLTGNIYTYNNIKYLLYSYTTLTS